jgi:hypothetical protein
LKPYGITSQTVALDDERPKGYTADRLSDAFRRYLPAPAERDPPAGVSNPVTQSPLEPEGAQTHVGTAMATSVPGDRESTCLSQATDEGLATDQVRAELCRP